MSVIYGPMGWSILPIARSTQPKRILLAAILFLSTLPVSRAAMGQESGSDAFGDVPAGHWADESIGWAVANDITRGVDEGLFGPNMIVTRAQIVTFLYRTVNLILGDGVHPADRQMVLDSSSGFSGEKEVIVVMNADGTNRRRLTESTHQDKNASWSPNGTQIVFQSDRDGDSEILVMDADGSNQYQLTHNEHEDESPSWSPDGTRIVFTGGPDREIFVINPDGTNPRQLTDNKRGHSSPNWSPDGTRIIFESERDGERDGDSEIYVMNADGSNQRQLTHNDYWDSAPSWSPDGRRIAFASRRDGDSEIFVMNADGSDQQQRTRNGSTELLPSWSPDSAQITFTTDGYGSDSPWEEGDFEIAVMNSDGSGQRLLTDNRSDDLRARWSPRRFSPGSETFSDVRAGHWADTAIGWAVANGIVEGVSEGLFDPDGTVPRAQIVTMLHRTVGLFPDGPLGTARHAASPSVTEGSIAFQSDVDGDDEIFVMDPDGTNLRQITHNPYPDVRPQWSPDGSRIAFNRVVTPAVWVMNADGTNQRRLAKVGNLTFAWSPDSTKIALLPYHEGETELFVIDIDGANLRQLTDNDLEEWGPSWSPDGAKIAFTANRDGTGEVFVINADGTNQRQISRGGGVMPVWSADGRLAYAGADSNKEENDYEIHVVEFLDGGHLLVRQYTYNDHNDSDPSWSPDGTRIVHFSDHDISVIVVRDYLSRRLGPWGTQLAWTPDSRQIMFQNRGDIYVINEDGTGARRLTGLQGSYIFDDVPPEHEANGPIGWAVTYGITSGVGRDQFDLDGTVTRAQIVTFLHRTANLLQSP